MRKKIIVIISLVFILCTHLFFAEEENQFAEAQLYQDGLQAFNQKSYVSALKYLYAFRVINKVRLENHKDLEIKIDKHIAYCEDLLKRLSNLNTSGSLIGSTFISASKVADPLEKQITTFNAQGYEMPDVEFKSIGKIVLDNEDVGYIIVGQKSFEGKESLTIKGFEGNVVNKYDLKSIIELEKLEKEKNILEKKIELEKLKKETLQKM